MIPEMSEKVHRMVGLANDYFHGYLSLTPNGVLYCSFSVSLPHAVHQIEPIGKFHKLLQRYSYI